MQACSSEHSGVPPEFGPQATAEHAPAVGDAQLICLDGIQLQEIFQMRFRVLQSCPAHLKAKYRSALSAALEAVHEAAQRRDPVKEVRAWKLFSLLPFWLLRKPLGQGRVGKAELSNRFELFTGGQWESFFAFGGDQGHHSEQGSECPKCSDTRTESSSCLPESATRRSFASPSVFDRGMCGSGFSRYAARVAKQATSDPTQRGASRGPGLGT